MGDGGAIIIDGSNTNDASASIVADEGFQIVLASTCSKLGGASDAA